MLLPCCYLASLGLTYCLPCGRCCRGDAELKTQLLDWFGHNPSVHLVMISNRYDQSDLDLLSHAHLRDTVNMAASPNQHKDKGNTYVVRLCANELVHCVSHNINCRRSTVLAFGLGRLAGGPDNRSGSRQIVVAGGSVMKILMRMVLPQLQVRTTMR